MSQSALNTAALGTKTFNTGESLQTLHIQAITFSASFVQLLNSLTHFFIPSVHSFSQQTFVRQTINAPP
jgi:hypothetical protein